MSVLPHLRHAVRSLVRTPVASISIVATLAICIGATTTVFSVLDAVLIRPLPFRESERLIWITSVTPDDARFPFSLPEFMDLRARTRTASLAAYAGWSTTLTTAEGAERLFGMRLSGDGFDVLGARPSAGRLLRAEDDSLDAPRVAVVSHGFWRTRFGARRNAVGATIVLGGEAYAIVGVLPEYFPLPIRNVDVVVPLAPDRDPRRHKRTSTNFLRVVGRLSRGATPESAERELSALTAQLKREYPDAYAVKLGVRARPLQQELIGDHRLTLLVIGGAVALLLAIALANVLGLLLIRAVAREGEIALRRALGASAGQATRQLLAEAGVLVVSASAIGTLLAWGGVRILVATAGAGIPRLSEATLDGTALGFLALLCVGVVMLFALVPLLAGARTPPQGALRAAARGSGGSPAQRRLRATFVIAQVALAVVVTSATASLLASLRRLEGVSLGFRPDSVFTARLTLPPAKYATPRDLVRFHDRFRQALASQPGVVSAGLISVAPLAGALATANIAPAGSAPASVAEWPNAHYRSVSPELLTTIGARLIAGRHLTRDDMEGGAPVAIVNAEIARQLFHDARPLGRVLLVNDNTIAPRAVTVVGVVESMRDVDLDGPPPLTLYVPIGQIPQDIASFAAGSQYWAVRVATPAASFGRVFLAALRATDRDVATSGLGEMRAFVDGALATRRFTVALMLGFAVVSLLLSALGVYAVMAYDVDQRRREIGVRIALGALPRLVIAEVLVRSLRLATVGIAAGVVGALVAGRAMAGLLFGIAPGDATVLVVTAMILFVAAAVASLIPASRAARTDPMVVLSGG